MSTERTLTNSSKFIRVAMVIMICALDIIPASVIMYFLKGKDVLISVRNASENLPGIVGQNLITISFSILLFVVMLFVLKGKFAEELFLVVKKEKRQSIPVIGLTIVLGIMLAVFLVVKEDKITVLYSLFYYLFIIAFVEEFVVRGVCVYLLKDFNTAGRYIIPNILFSLMHIFSYSNWGELNVTYIMHFMTSNLFGLFLVGCFFQLLKEKSGTLWVPILLHAIMDYSGV